MSAMPGSTWWLGAAAKRAPNVRALTVEGETLTYRDLAESSRAVAAALAKRGVGRGDRVAWLGRSSRGVVELLHAAQLLGAPLCPVSVRATAAELAAQLQRLRPRMVVGDRDQQDRVAAIAGVGYHAIATTEDLATTAVVPHPSDDAIDPSALLAMLCTSGTTGAPKAVMLSNAACLASALAAGKRLDYREAQAWLATLPLHHVGGLSILLRAAIFGAEVVLRDGFDAERTRADIARFAIRHASLVPTMLHRLLAIETAPPATGAPTSCCYLVGGAALSAELARRATNAGLDVRATYGMTEAASQVTTTERGEVVEYPETTGHALDGVSVRIEAPDREGYGEIVVSGRTLFHGYYDDIEATRAALRGSALFTGDIGRMDADGRLYVASRRVDLIVTGGENVRPEEVELVLESHPSVAEAGVYGMPDAEWGERVAAVVVAHDNARIDPVELEQWCRVCLATFKIPRRIDVATSLPRTSGGKLIRARLRGHT